MVDVGKRESHTDQVLKTVLFFSISLKDKTNTHTHIMVNTSAMIDDLPQKTLGETFLTQDSANEIHQEKSFQSEVRRCRGMPATVRTTLMSAMKATDEPEEDMQAKVHHSGSVLAASASPVSILDMSLCVNVGMLIVGVLVVMLVMNSNKQKKPACGYFRGGSLTPEVAKQAVERMLDYN